MNKQQLITTLADKAGLAKVDALRLVDALEQTIREQTQQGNEVVFASIGKFKVKTTTARTGRNPKTGESLAIPAKRKVVFLPGKALKDSLN
ncbi:HU family DNA-binding protein [Aquitalea sp. LB_tupeE]|uniref:HU family DNA-binding protein n=1 Tax=Aquitalea sp. LB_tupeE TaxID=2748078 RepID=UPI00210479C4|nr:HU family DNA-binding protein [Aquitalea sp. LB_tupeE]